MKFGLALMCGLLTAGLASAGSAQLRLPPNKAKHGFRYGHPSQQKIKNLPPILRRLVESNAKAVFSGERTVTIRKGLKLVSHEEFVVKQGPRMRFEFPGNSPYHGQVIVDENGQRRHFYPREKVIRVEPSYEDEAVVRLLKGSKKDIDALTDVSDGGKIASLSTQRVDVYDRLHQLRQQLWIDPKSGVLLKRVGYGPKGSRVASYAYSSIDFHPRIDAGAFRLPNEGVRVLTPADLVRSLAKELKIVPFILDRQSGFRLVSAKRMKAAGEEVLAQIYVGPGGRLSLFEVPSILSAPPPARPNAKTESVSRVMGRETIVLVGKYPKDTLTRLINGLVKL